MDTATKHALDAIDDAFKDAVGQTFKVYLDKIVTQQDLIDANTTARNGLVCCGKARAAMIQIVEAQNG